MEFRDAVLKHPLPPERCAREFSLPPARQDAQDKTEEMIEKLRNR